MYEFYSGIDSSACIHSAHIIIDESYHSFLVSTERKYYETRQTNAQLRRRYGSELMMYYLKMKNKEKGKKKSVRDIEFRKFRVLKLYNITHAYICVRNETNTTAGPVVLCFSSLFTFYYYTCIRETAYELLTFVSCLYGGRGGNGPI